jgi:hypothetical protein
VLVRPTTTGVSDSDDNNAFCMVIIAVVAVADLGSPVSCGKKRTTKSTPTAKLKPNKAKVDLPIVRPLPKRSPTARIAAITRIGMWRYSFLASINIEQILASEF